MFHFKLHYAINAALLYRTFWNSTLKQRQETNEPGLYETRFVEVRVKQPTNSPAHRL